jgi:hypothetical protein
MCPEQKPISEKDKKTTMRTNPKDTSIIHRFSQHFISIVIGLGGNRRMGPLSSLLLQVVSSTF